MDWSEILIFDKNKFQHVTGISRKDHKYGLSLTIRLCKILILLPVSAIVYFVYFD